MTRLLLVANVDPVDGARPDRTAMRAVIPVPAHGVGDVVTVRRGDAW